MGRHTGSKSTGHRIQYMGGGAYRLCWCIDRHYASSRFRFPTIYKRDTDKAGAKRFAKKWGVEMPTTPEKG